MRKTLVIFFGIILILTFINCDNGSTKGGNNSGGNNSGSNNSNIIGTWKGQGYTYIFTSIEYTLDKGSGQIEEKGTYSVSGEIVSMQSTHTDDNNQGGVLAPDTSSKRIGTVNGNSMDISYPGYSYVSHTVYKQ